MLNLGPKVEGYDPKIIPDNAIFVKKSSKGALTAVELLLSVMLLIDIVCLAVVMVDNHRATETLLVPLISLFVILIIGIALISAFKKILTLVDIKTAEVYKNYAVYRYKVYDAVYELTDNFSAMDPYYKPEEDLQEGVADTLENKEEE